MGAKTALKLRARGTAFKCDLCGRKLMTMDALIIHQRTAHNIISRRNKPKPVNKPSKPPKVEVQIEKRDPLPQKTAPKDKLTEPESDKNDKKNTPVKTVGVFRRKSVEFTCPKCFSVFARYFPARKHIQKYHCVNKLGEKVSPDSSSLIQPIRIDLCTKCNKKVKSIQTHLCDNECVGKNGEMVIVCIACDKWLPSLKLFDMHILSSHAEEVESMFFPLSTDFTQWKKDMEQQTGIKYVILEKYDSKRYYHCNFVKDTDKRNNESYHCPSTIVVQEYPKGIQVHFYKKHFKHRCVAYALMEKYKKFTITSFLKRSEEYSNLTTFPSDENDLYVQFKSLMEGIIVDAAKINIDTLKMLHGKALELTSILTNYDEEPEESDNNHVTSIEYSQTASKRKCLNSAETTLAFKRTKEFDEKNNLSPKIVNSFSLATREECTNEIKTEVNDSDDNGNNDNVNNDNGNNDESDQNKQGNDWDPFSSAFNDSYKDFVVKNFPTLEKDIKKKNKKAVVKTKIGQFKPSISPKSFKTQSEEVKTPQRLSFDKPAVCDIRYEVKEQQNGCNILILKL